jgi:hypothetical protein
MRLVSSIFLLMDISGYTPFVRMHKLNLLHAEKVIKDLLEVIIETSRSPLKVNEIEGDAVCFYAEQGDDPAATAAEVMRQAIAMMDAFAVKSSQLDGVNICICDACSVVRDLKLKGFLHAGDCSIKKLSRFKKEQLGGEDIILAHKLMKNDVPSNEYLVVSNAFGALTEARPPWTSETRIEMYEEFGDTPVEVYYFGAEQAARAVECANETKQGIGAKLGRIGELMKFSVKRLSGFGT